MSFIATESSDSEPEPEPVALHPLQAPPRPGQHPRLPTSSLTFHSSSRTDIQPWAILAVAAELLKPSATTYSADPIASSSRLAPRGPDRTGLPRTTTAPTPRDRTNEWQTVGAVFHTAVAKGKQRANREDEELLRVKEVKVEGEFGDAGGQSGEWRARQDGRLRSQ